MHRARELPLWVVNTRANIRRWRSLRWRTFRALRELGGRWTIEDAVVRFGRSMWGAAGRAWVIPSVTVALVVTLQVLNVVRAPLAVFHDEQRSRELLGLLWQVEAAAVALVVAAALFAFESLTRERTNLPLVEYANRSRLTHFLIYSGSGLVAIPIALFATVGRPAPAAALAAAVISVSALALLPAFLTRSMSVVHPDWMQAARLDDVHRAVAARVKKDAFERLGLIQLEAWAKGASIEILHRMVFDADRVTESAPASGVVTDIDLDRLETLGRRHPDAFAVVTRLADQVWNGASLVARKSPDGPVQDQRAVTMTARPSFDEMDQIVGDLHEEGLEAIRRESPAAAERVMSMYAETWLAWPRGWAHYGQRLEGGLLEGVEPFRIRPSDQLRRHVWIQMEMALDRGLRDHTESIIGLLYTVSFEAQALRAGDLVREMYLLARWFLSVRSQSYPELAESVVERAWRFQVEICERTGRDLGRDGGADLEVIDEAVREVRAGYRSMIESLRILLDEGRYEAFKALDNRLRKILEFWEPSHREPLARHVLEDPARFSAGEDELRRARQVVKEEKLERDLSDYRRGGRLAVLGWMLHRGKERPISDELAGLIRSVSGTLGSVSDVVRATGVALSDREDFLSSWLMLERPELEVGFVDTDGPVLTALAMVLLSRTRLDRIPPDDWMSEHRSSRLRELIPEVARRYELWGRLGEDLDELRDRADDYVDLVAQAERDQKQIEGDDLIEMDLDPTKVEEFRDELVAGWRANRSVEEVAERGRARVEPVALDEWEWDTYGFARLDPKGLFVTPTNWVGLDTTARGYGRRLAQAEVTAIVKEVVAKSRGVVGSGDPSERLEQLLSAVRADGFEPTLIILPIGWRLADALGLRDWHQHPRPERLGRNFKGEFDGVAVIDWWEVPKDRMFAVDLAEFCLIQEAVNPEDQPSPPEVTVERIDEERADGIISSWEPAEDDDAEMERRRRVLTSVRVAAFRPFRLEVHTSSAARSMEVPDSYRD